MFMVACLWASLFSIELQNIVWNLADENKFRVHRVEWNLPSTHINFTTLQQQEMIL